MLLRGGCVFMCVLCEQLACVCTFGPVPASLNHFSASALQHSCLLSRRRLCGHLRFGLGGCCFPTPPPPSQRPRRDTQTQASRTMANGRPFRQKASDVMDIGTPPDMAGRPKANPASTKIRRRDGPQSRSRVGPESVDIGSCVLFRGRSGRGRSPPIWSGTASLWWSNASPLSTFPPLHTCVVR